MLVLFWVYNHLSYGLKTGIFQTMFQDNSIKRWILAVSEALNMLCLGKTLIFLSHPVILSDIQTPVLTVLSLIYNIVSNSSQILYH